MQSKVTRKYNHMYQKLFYVVEHASYYAYNHIYNPNKKTKNKQQLLL